MKLQTVMISRALILFAVALPAVAQEEAVSPVSGFLQVTCPGGSDTRVSVPFHAVPKWSGPLSAAPSSPATGVVRMEFAFPTGIAAGEFASAPHLVLCGGGTTAPGRPFRVLAHGSGNVDVAAEAGDLAALTAGDQVEIFSAWTINGLFPPGQQTTFHPSTGRLASGRGSELLIFNRETAGINLAPSRRLFLNENGWLEAGTFAAAGSELILPGESFVIRHPAGTAPTTFTTMHQVYAGTVSLPLKTSLGKRQDSVVAPPRPVPVALEDLGISGSFAESLTTGPADRVDELLVFDNSAAALNKAPAAVYFRSGGNWIEDTAGFPLANATLIEPSAGLLVRKAAAAADVMLQWPNQPVYDLSLP